MKAAVKTQPGPGIEIQDVDKPQIKPDELLIEVKACGICGTDLHIYEWGPGADGEVILPRILGHEFSGVVTEVGSNVKDFQVGDRVIPDCVTFCGKCFFCRLGKVNICEKRCTIGIHKDGAFAEYVVVPAISTYHMPKNLSFEEAALAEPLGVAVHAIELSHLKPGDSVAVLGPGPIGLGLLLAAKVSGASQVIVTGTTRSWRRIELAKKLGGKVFNVDQEDPVKNVKELTEGRGADVVFEASGSITAVRQATEIVRAGGEIILIGLFPTLTEIDLTRLVIKEVTIQTSRSRLPRTWLRTISLMSSGKIDVRPLITHKVSLDKIKNGFESLRLRKAIKVIVTP